MPNLSFLACTKVELQPDRLCCHNSYFDLDPKIANNTVTTFRCEFASISPKLGVFAPKIFISKVNFRPTVF